MKCCHCLKIVLEWDRVFVSGKCYHQKCLGKVARIEARNRKKAREEKAQMKLEKWSK